MIFIEGFKTFLWLFFYFILMGWLNFSLAQEQGDNRPQVTIERKDKTIQVIQNGTRAEGARTILLNPRCKEEVRLSTFFAPTPAFVETLVNETRIISSIAFIEKPDKKEEEEGSENEPEPEAELEAGQSAIEQDPGTEPEPETNSKLEAGLAVEQKLDVATESDLEPKAGSSEGIEAETSLAPEEGVNAELDLELALAVTSESSLESDVETQSEEVEGEEERLEMFGGTLDFTDSTRCPENIQESTAADVTVEEGRSTITGSKFSYDNATGIGNMVGPVNLERRAAGDSPALSGNSDNMEFNVDEDLTILQGNVTVESDGRVSEADTVEFDEQASLALLFGNPAKSTKDNDVVQGNIITYYLDSNDVVVDKGIQATFELEP